MSQSLPASDESTISTTEEVTVSPVQREIITALAENSPVTVVEAPEYAPIVVHESDEVQVTETISEIVVVTAGAQGAPGRPAEEEVPYAKRTDFDTENIIYKGEAAVGTVESSAGWRIRRITLSNDGDAAEEWANGNAQFINVWDDRASLSYL